MKYCKDCWSFGRCNADGKTVDFPVYDGVCIDFDECKPMTNADRIRAMSDEELAVWMCDMCVCSECCTACIAKPPACPGESEGAWLEWLQQPAKED